MYTAYSHLVARNIIHISDSLAYSVSVGKEPLDYLTWTEEYGIDCLCVCCSDMETHVNLVHVRGRTSYLEVHILCFHC